MWSGPQTGCQDRKQGGNRAIAPHPNPKCSKTCLFVVNNNQRCSANKKGVGTHQKNTPILKQLQTHFKAKREGVGTAAVPTRVSAPQHPWQQVPIIPPPSPALKMSACCSPELCWSALGCTLTFFFLYQGGRQIGDARAVPANEARCVQGRFCSTCRRFRLRVSNVSAESGKIFLSPKPTRCVVCQLRRTTRPWVKVRIKQGPSWSSSIAASTPSLCCSMNWRTKQWCKTCCPLKMMSTSK